MGAYLSTCYGPGTGLDPLSHLSLNTGRKRLHFHLTKMLKLAVVDMPFISALGWQRREDLCEFEASLVNIVLSRTAKAT